MKLKQPVNLLFFIVLFCGLNFIGHAMAGYPPDPTSDLPWDSSPENSVTDVEFRFNAARTNENTPLGTSIPMMTLPSQGEWDGLTDAEKALWLIKRIDRGVHPLHGIESNVMAIAQYYA